MCDSFVTMLVVWVLYMLVVWSQWDVFIKPCTYLVCGHCVCGVGIV